jgi:hypothetical protein
VGGAAAAPGAGGAPQPGRLRGRGGGGDRAGPVGGAGGPGAGARRAPRRGSPLRVPGGAGRGGAPRDRLWGAQRGRRPEGGGGPDRDGAPGRHQAQEGQDPRRHFSGHDLLRPRARPGRRPRGDPGARPRHPARGSASRGARHRRADPRGWPHPQPRRCGLAARRGPRGAGSLRRRAAAPGERSAGDGAAGLPRRPRRHPGPGGLPRLRGAGGARRAGRPLTRVDAATAGCGGNPRHQLRRGRHQLRAPGVGPAPPRLRSRRTAGRASPSTPSISPHCGAARCRCASRSRGRSSPPWTARPGS